MARNLTPPTEIEVESLTRFGKKCSEKSWNKLKKSHFFESLASINTFFVFSKIVICLIRNVPGSVRMKIFKFWFLKIHNFHQIHGSLIRGFHFFALLLESIFEFYQRWNDDFCSKIIWKTDFRVVSGRQKYVFRWILKSLL